MKKRPILDLGESFQYKGDIDKYMDYFNKYMDIYQCYNRPSYTKVNVYNYYKELLTKNSDHVLEYGVRGYNCMMFTIHAIIIKNNIKYYLLITKYNNYYKEVKNED